MALEDDLVRGGMWPGAVSTISAGYGTLYADPTGTANALVVSILTGPSGISDGDIIGVGYLAANTGPVTLAVTIGTSTTPAQPIKKFVRGTLVPLVAGDIQGQLLLSRDAPASCWVLLNPYTQTGTNTNDLAGAGNLGEYLVASTPAPGSALVTGVALNVLSLALTAGDWDVYSQCNFTSAATTSITGYSAGVTVTTGVLPGQLAAGGVGPDALSTTIQPATVPGAGTNQLKTTMVRVSVAAATTIYLVASAAFTVSTLTVFGTLTARRAR